MCVCVVWLSVAVGAVIFLVVIFIEWFVNFFIIGLDFSRVPAVTTNLSAVLGTVIFNYAFVITVPSWVNEKVIHVTFMTSDMTWRVYRKKEWVFRRLFGWVPSLVLCSTSPSASSVLTSLLVNHWHVIGAWALTFDSHQDILDGIVQQYLWHALTWCWHDWQGTWTKVVACDK